MKHQNYNYLIFLIVLINALLFLTTKAPLGLDPDDFNYKMLYFYNNGVFRDAFNPSLFSINGAYSSFCGAILRFFIEKVSPAFIVPLYLGTLFLGYSIVTFIFFKRNLLYQIFALIFFIILNIKGLDILFYYHLDKYFALFLTYFSIISFRLNARSGSFSWCVLLICSSIAYPTVAVFNFVCACILTLYIRTRAATIFLVGFSLLLILFKYLTLGVSTWTIFTPIVGDGIGGYLNFLRELSSRIDQNFYNYAYLFLSFIFISFSFRWFGYLRLKKCLIELFLIFSAVCCISLVTIIASLIFTRYGLFMPSWEIFEYVTFPSILLLIYSGFLLFITLIFSWAQPWNRALVALSFALFLSAFLHKSILLTNVFKNNGVIEVLNRYKDLDDRLKKNNGCIPKNELTRFDWVLMRTQFNAAWLPSFYINFSNPKDIIDRNFACAAI